jgi:hypothetical protein
MDSRKRLGEAKFFLDQLKNHESDSEKFEYYMTAFLTSWRSVMDVMLYDVAEHFLGLSRDDQYNEEEIRAIAEKKGCKEVINFVSCWSGKQKILLKTPLWNKRNVSFHRGYPSMNIEFIYLGNSGGTSGTISVNLRAYTPDLSGEYPIRGPVPQPDFASKRFSFSDIPGRSAISVCEEAYDQIERFVDEAEKVLNLKL